MNVPGWWSSYWPAFVFTQVVEIPIYMKVFRCRFLSAFGASALTHPIVWFAFPMLPFGWGIRVVCAEIFAWAVEGAYFCVQRRSKPWRWSFVANAASLSLGLLCRHWFGFP